MKPSRRFARLLGPDRRVADFLTDRPTDRPTDRTNERPNERTNERPNERTTERPTDRPTTIEEHEGVYYWCIISDRLACAHPLRVSGCTQAMTAKNRISSGPSGLGPWRATRALECTPP